MRPIKYRAWDKHDKKMYPVIVMDLVQEKGGLFLGKGKGPVSWEDIELLAFTGLHDRNGTEIYEGDVVVGKPHHYTDEVKGVVKYGALAFAFVGKTKKGKEWFDTITNPKITKADHIEVIGNICENPELLK